MGRSPITYSSHRLEEGETRLGIVLNSFIKVISYYNWHVPKISLMLMCFFVVIHQRPPFWLNRQEAITLIYWILVVFLPLV